MVDGGTGKVRFDCTFNVGGQLGMLMDYLGNLEDMTFKDAVMRSARSYWLPLALKEAGVTGMELEVAGNNAAIDLIRQVKEICLRLGIDSTQFVGLLGGRVAALAPMQPPVGAIVPAVQTLASEQVEPTARTESDGNGKSSARVGLEGFSGMGELLSDWPVNPVDD